VHDPAEDVPNVPIDPEIVLGLRSGTAERMNARGGKLLGTFLRAQQDGVRIVGRDLIGEDGHENEEGEDRAADDGVSLAQEIGQRVTPDRGGSRAAEVTLDQLHGRRRRDSHRQVNLTLGSR
jgi:hypothetical protein